ncbi:MAG: class I SAM-dependent methyltransferase [Pseudanabaena sp. ELA645]|jgi:hypothetical protein
MNCPICNSTSEYLFSKYDCSILSCQKCHHQFADILPDSNHTQTVYSDDYFNSGGAGYDLISMIQVISHFFDLQKALTTAAAMTNPNGYWLIETWNRESWTAKISGQNWHEYSPPSVLHWFSPQDLEQLAAQFGFHKIASGRPEKWINGAHVKSLLRYKLGRSPFGKLLSKMLGIIPDQLLIPYPAEDLFWILFQKSTVI